MPLTAKGEKILKSMEKTYGSKEKAEQVLYASKNAGLITGIDSATDEEVTVADAIAAVADQVEGLHRRVDAYCARRADDVAAQPAKDIRADASRDAEKKLTVEYNGDFDLPGLLRHIGETAAIGHSFDVVVDPGDAEHERRFGVDGDGADRIRLK